MSSSQTQSYINKKFKDINDDDNAIYQIYSLRGNEKLYFWNLENQDEAYNCHLEEFQKNITLGKWVFV